MPIVENKCVNNNRGLDSNGLKLMSLILIPCEIIKAIDYPKSLNDSKEV